MPIQFYTWLKKALLVLPILALSFAGELKAQCTWIPFAPWIDPPPVKFANRQCGAGNGIYIAKCSTDKAIINFTNTSTCPPSSDTNNYNYFGGPGGKMCKVNAGAKLDLHITPALTGISTGSILKLSVWVDWNHNGTYEEGTSYTELVSFTAAAPTGTTTKTGILSGASLTGNSTFTFDIPKSAKNGLTRMRVRLTGNGQPSAACPACPTLTPASVSACGLSDHGECEEYDMEIVNPCKPPSVISVSDITCKGANICWALVDNADMYDYWIDTCKTPGCSIQPPIAPGPPWPLFDTKVGNCITAPNGYFPNIMPETKYYIMVHSICDTIKKPTWQYYQTSEWAIDSFTTLACCNAPTDVVVSDVKSTTANARWNPVYTALMYEYAVNTTPNNPPPFGTKLTGTSIELKGLTHSKTYYFCVRALCTPTPKSNWECTPFATQNTTSISGVQDETPVIAAYPNPVKNTVTVSVDNFNTEGGTLAISDISGRIVHSVKATTAQTEINMSSFAQGLYLVKYTSVNGNSQVIKITKE